MTDVPPLPTRHDADTRPGVVVEFDDHVGLGTVRLDDGRLLPFHCIEIVDGTRAIEAGVAVTCRPALRLGRTEAAEVTRRRA